MVKRGSIGSIEVANEGGCRRGTGGGTCFTCEPGNVALGKMDGQTVNTGSFGCYIKAHYSPCRFRQTQIPSIDILSDLITVGIHTHVGNVKPCLIRAFVKILVQVCEDGDSENDIDVDMAVKFIDQFRNMSAIHRSASIRHL